MIATTIQNMLDWSFLQSQTCHKIYNNLITLTLHTNYILPWVSYTTQALSLQLIHVHSAIGVSNICHNKITPHHCVSMIYYTSLSHHNNLSNRNIPPIYTWSKVIKIIIAQRYGDTTTHVHTLDFSPWLDPSSSSSNERLILDLITFYNEDKLKNTQTTKYHV